ncbi:MAG: hypothetical protein ACRDSS_14030 [Actinocrinis sp.]
MNIRKKLAATAVVGAFVTVGLAAAAPAFATEGDGYCTSQDSDLGGDLCLYYNSNFAGARFNDPVSDNYAGHVFVAWSGGSAGAGQGVKNNAASVQNWDQVVQGNVYYNSGQTGPVQHIAAWTGVNFNSTLKNENASQNWG